MKNALKFLQKQKLMVLSMHDGKNHQNRKAIQGLGICRPAKSLPEIRTGVKFYNQNFPDFKDQISPAWLKKNEWNTRMWILKPTYIKYWDDEVYGEQQNEEFELK